MAKKSRRVKNKGQQIRLSPAQMVQPGMRESKIADTLIISAQGQSVPQASDLREEYRYVIADLKRIGIIAVAMLAVLVALALLLP